MRDTIHNPHKFLWKPRLPLWGDQHDRFKRCIEASRCPQWPLQKAAQATTIHTGKLSLTLRFGEVLRHTDSLDIESVGFEIHVRYWKGKTKSKLICKWESKRERREWEIFSMKWDMRIEGERNRMRYEYRILSPSENNFTKTIQFLIVAEVDFWARHFTYRFGEGLQIFLSFPIRKNPTNYIGDIF